MCETESGQKSVVPLLVAPVDVRNVHLGEYLTHHHSHSLPVTGESLFSLTCQTPKTANIQGMIISIMDRPLIDDVCWAAGRESSL